MNLPNFQEVMDLGSHGVPDSIEWCIKNSIDSLGREMMGVCPWVWGMDD